MVILRKIQVLNNHWNLNGLTVHDFIRISLLQAYITRHNYDLICLSETFLNSSIDGSDTRISIDGYNLIRSDHPNDSKRDSVCIYYKERIPLSDRNLLTKWKMFFDLYISFPKSKSRNCLIYFLAT